MHVVSDASSSHAQAHSAMLHMDCSCCRVLVVECVKQLDDAFVLLEVLQAHDVPLLQVS